MIIIQTADTLSLLISIQQQPHSGADDFLLRFASKNFIWVGGSETLTPIGDYFSVTFPNDCNQDECYNFKWQNIEELPDPFLNYPYL